MDWHFSVSKLLVMAAAMFLMPLAQSWSAVPKTQSINGRQRNGKFVASFVNHAVFSSNYFR